MIPIILDFETRSTIDLTQRGTMVYARDQTTEVICLGYQIGLGGTTYVKRYLDNIWAPPVRLAQALWHPDTILVAHNALFERAIWEHVMGWPPEPPERWFCTSNLAGLYNLPQSLGELTLYLWPEEREAQKDIEGKRLIHQLSKPMAHTGFYNTDPDLLSQLYAYCAQDVKVTAKVWAKLPPASTSEREIQVADIRANERGYQVDRDFCEKAAQIDDALQQDVIQECIKRTGLRPTQTAKLKSWLADRNCILPDMSRQTIEQALLAYPDWPQSIRRVLELRIAGSRGSTQKFNSLLRHCTPEYPRVTHHTRYAAGNTGRWIARGAQIHNFRSRNLLSYDLPGIKHQVLTDTLPKDVDIRNYVGGAIRAAIIAQPGYHLALGDYSGMENRMLMYLAGEERQLDLIRKGMDVYRDLATRVFGIPEEDVNPWQRQICKHMVLGLGFGMGPTAFFTNLKFKFQVDLNREICQAIVGPELVELTHTYHQRLAENPRLRDRIIESVCLDNQPLTGKILMGLVTTTHLVKVFRQGFADLMVWWKTLESTVKDLLESPPGTTIDLGRSGHCRKTRQAVVFELPSGRPMYYWQPRYRRSQDPVTGETRQELIYQQATGGQVKTLHGYGARFGANLVQGQSRDIMALAFRDLDRSSDYYPVVTVHDEIISETRCIQPELYETEIMRSAQAHDWIRPVPLKVDADISPCWLSKG